jgi:hypothetical protein
MAMDKSGETFNVVPNPVAGMARILFPAQERPSSLELFDVSGRMLEEIRLSGRQETSWSAGHLPQGCYVLKSVAGDKTYTRKIQVQR